MWILPLLEVLKTIQLSELTYGTIYLQFFKFVCFCLTGRAVGHFTCSLQCIACFLIGSSSLPLLVKEKKKLMKELGENWTKSLVVDIILIQCICDPSSSNVSFSAYILINIVWKNFFFERLNEFAQVGK